MRSNSIVRASLVVASLCLSTASFAALLNDLTGFPSVVTDQTGTVTYNKTTKALTIRSAPLAIRFSATTPPHFVTAVPVNQPQLLTVDVKIGSNGQVVDGYPAEDLYVYGSVTDDNNVTYTGVLLTGEIVKFGFLDSGTTDQYDFRFTLSGGALAPLFNGMDLGLKITSENSTFANSFNMDFGGGCKGVLGPIPALTGFQGCTPGYWKQPQHFDSYPAPYTPNTLFESVFGRDVPGNPTIREALATGGGGLNALMRHTGAALLNAASNSVYTEPEFNTPAKVIAAFQAAYDSGMYEATKNLLEASNEQGCPLN